MLSALLALCTQNPPVIFHKGPVMRSFDKFFVVSLNKLLNKQLRCQWYEPPWHSCDITVIYICNIFGISTELSTAPSSLSLDSGLGQPQHPLKTKPHATQHKRSRTSSPSSCHQAMLANNVEHPPKLPPRKHSMSGGMIVSPWKQVLYSS